MRSSGLDSLLRIKLRMRARYAVKFVAALSVAAPRGICVVRCGALGNELFVNALTRSVVRRRRVPSMSVGAKCCKSCEQ